MNIPVPIQAVLSLVFFIAMVLLGGYGLYTVAEREDAKRVMCHTCEVRHLPKNNCSVIDLQRALLKKKIQAAQDQRPVEDAK